MVGYPIMSLPSQRGLLHTSLLYFGYRALIEINSVVVSGNKLPNRYNSCHDTLHKNKTEGIKCVSAEQMALILCHIIKKHWIYACTSQ